MNNVFDKNQELKNEQGLKEKNKSKLSCQWIKFL